MIPDSSITIGSYNADAVQFNQTNCGLCRHDFETNQKIVQLACQHIFHEECFPSCLIRCPYCLKEISDRFGFIEAKALKEEIRLFLDNIFSLILSKQISDDMLNAGVENLSEVFNRQMIREAYRPVELLREINGDISTIYNGTSESQQNLITKHVVYLYPLFNNFFQSQIDSGEFFSLNELCDTIRLKAWGFFNLFQGRGQPLENHLRDLLDAIQQDPNLNQKVQEMNASYKKNTYRQLASLSSLQRYKQIWDLCLQGSQKRILLEKPSNEHDHLLHREIQIINKAQSTTITFLPFMLVAFVFFIYKFNLD
jgi:hypothetical protein